MKRIVLFITIFLFLISFDSAFIPQQETLAEIDEAFDLAVNQVLSISPCALKPKWSDTFQNGSFAAGPAEAYVTDSASAFADMYAPVYLPQGATIKRVIGVCIDNDGTLASNYVLMRLVRSHNYFNTSETVAELSTDGLSPSSSKRVLRSSSISYPMVDNTYLYSLRVRFGNYGSSGLIFYGFWIIYE